MWNVTSYCNSTRFKLRIVGICHEGSPCRNSQRPGVKRGQRGGLEIVFNQAIDAPRDPGIYDLSAGFYRYFLDIVGADIIQLCLVILHRHMDMASIDRFWLTYGLYGRNRNSAPSRIWALGWCMSNVLAAADGGTCSMSRSSPSDSISTPCNT
ncbi:hypothetical protein V6N12_025635 [Hibiscus sabdariffa]|uniref:Uncharacterized protein n=1 Tax=Hibiscus sabdariffa TaxID=183260 RepID=A0ABR2CKW5_9ROSI